MSFLAPSAGTPPPPPPPPPNPPIMANPSVQQAAAAAAASASKGTPGFEGTDTSGPQGAAAPATAKKTLGGGSPGLGG